MMIFPAMGFSKYPQVVLKLGANQRPRRIVGRKLIAAISNFLKSRKGCPALRPETCTFVAFNNLTHRDPSTLRTGSGRRHTSQTCLDGILRGPRTLELARSGDIQPLPAESLIIPVGAPHRLRARVLERETGFEPVSPAWAANICPLNYSRSLRFRFYSVTSLLRSSSEGKAQNAK